MDKKVEFRHSSVYMGATYLLHCFEKKERIFWTSKKAKNQWLEFALFK